MSGLHGRAPGDDSIIFDFRFLIVDCGKANPDPKQALVRPPKGRPKVRNRRRQGARSVAIGVAARLGTK